MNKSSERICFIVNPSAGRSGALKKIEWLKKTAAERWSDFEVLIPSDAAELSLLAKDASRNFDTIVACGGDGTIHLVVNSIDDYTCRIGIIPMGSGNDFANALSLPSDPLDCLDLIRSGKGKTRQIDLLRITGDLDILCVNTVGIGLDGWANYYASTAGKLRGQQVYIYGILKAVFNFRGSMMRMKICSTTTSPTLNYEKQFLMVTLCNGPEEGGGFKVAPEAVNSDGWLNVLMIDKLSVARVLWYLPKFLFQPRRRLKGVNRMRCKSIRLESEQAVAVHCDGEFLGSHIQKIQATVEPGRLCVIGP